MIFLHSNRFLSIKIPDLILCNLDPFSSINFLHVFKSQIFFFCKLSYFQNRSMEYFSVQRLILDLKSLANELNEF